MKKLLSTLLFFFGFSLGLMAENDPLWKQNFDKNVEWTKLASNGVLLVGTSDWGLHGVDAASGKRLWSSDKLFNQAKSMKGADGKKQEYTENLMQILESETSPAVSNFGLVRFNNNIDVSSLILVNLLTGELVIDPASAGMPVLKFLGKETAYFNYEGSGFVAGLNAVVISGDGTDPKTGKDFTITKYIQLPEGKVLWENNEVASSMLPIATEDGGLLMVGEKTIAKLNPTNGQILWRMEVQERKMKYEAFDANVFLTTGYFYQKRGSNGLLQAVSLKDGKVLWENELSTKKAPQLSALSFGVVVADDKNFNLFDAENGQLKWTASKLDGMVIDLGGSKGIAVVEKDKYLTVLDKDSGKDKWSQKVKGIRLDQVTGAGLMYWDGNYTLGLIDFEGKDLWDKKDRIKGEGHLRARPSLDKEIFYSDEKVYAINLVDGSQKVLIDKVKFEEKETPDNLEYIGDAFVLSSSQNMLGFDENGKILYQNHWGSPKISLAGRIALRTMQVAATAMASASALAAGDAYGGGGFGSIGGTTVQQRQANVAAQSFNDMNSAFAQAANQRFKASKSKGMYNLILTDVDGRVGLKQIDKTTGKEMAAIVLDDKNPTYDFDPVKGIIFYKPSKSEVYCYAMN